MKFWKFVAVGAVLAVGLSACGGGGDDATETPSVSDTPAASDTPENPDPTDAPAPPDNPGRELAEGGTFTMAVAGDPGSLNPLNNTLTASTWLFRFLYDALIYRDADGSVQGDLAESWEFDGTTAVFKIREGVTCSDGSAFTPSVIAKSFAYLKDPENASVMIGAVIPNRDFTFEADDEANTFTLTLGSPFGLLIDEMSFLPLPCGAGADNPNGLTTTSSGSGPFVLTEVVPNTSFTMTKRDGYTWGLNGGRTDAPGMPDTVVMTVVSTESTAANLLINGQANAAVINGPDADRVRAAGATSELVVTGDVAIVFNQTEGHPGADRDVRLALTQALDRGEVGAIATQGLVTEPGQSVNAATPRVCDD
ncbi:MAG: ABC transporter substrate-binding protein, partial [Micrococcales bacterium]|nr:ABC transporter substrate-binding protein [Micrococcales bacterium]